jgi:hypothetical protein
MACRRWRFRFASAPRLMPSVSQTRLSLNQTSKMDIAGLDVGLTLVDLTSGVCRTGPNGDLVTHTYIDRLSRSEALGAPLNFAAIAIDAPILPVGQLHYRGRACEKVFVWGPSRTAASAEKATFLEPDKLSGVLALIRLTRSQRRSVQMNLHAPSLASSERTTLWRHSRMPFLVCPWLIRPSVLACRVLRSSIGCTHDGLNTRVTSS